jgi:hypothetical protein
MIIDLCCACPISKNGGAYDDATKRQVPSDLPSSFFTSDSSHPKQDKDRKGIIFDAF